MKNFKITFLTGALCFYFFIIFFFGWSEKLILVSTLVLLMFRKMFASFLLRVEFFFLSPPCFWQQCPPHTHTHTFCNKHHISPLVICCHFFSLYLLTVLYGLHNCLLLLIAYLSNSSSLCKNLTLECICRMLDIWSG